MKGLYVLVAGPDGTGKSTIAHGVEAALLRAGVQVRRSHWRPGLIAGSRHSEVSTVDHPHDQAPRSPLAAAAKLAVVFADQFIGGRTTWHRARTRGILIVERGWLDVVVDPRRYRVSRRLAALWARAGLTLPRADLALVCSGDSRVIHARKPEIGAAEVGRQCRQWERSAHLAARHVVFLDTVEQPVEAAVRAATDAVLARFDDGWRRVPLMPDRLSMRSQGRFEVARLYRPHTARARLACNTERHVPEVMRHKVPAPIPDLDSLWRLLKIQPTAVGAMRSSRPDRWILSAATSAFGTFIIKTGPIDDAGLRNEARLLSMPLGGPLSFARPTLVLGQPWRDRFIVATRAEDVERGMDVSFDDVLRVLHGLRRAQLGGEAITHGDFAPWNLVMTSAGPLLLDWEEARVSDEPLWDLTHYLVVSGALLGRYSPRTVLSLLTRPGSAGVQLLGATRPAVDPRPHIRRYLTCVDPQDLRVRHFRDQLLERLQA